MSLTYLNTPLHCRGRHYLFTIQRYRTKGMFSNSLLNEWTHTYFHLNNFSMILILPTKRHPGFRIWFNFRHEQEGKKTDHPVFFIFNWPKKTWTSFSPKMAKWPKHTKGMQLPLITRKMPIKATTKTSIYIYQNGKKRVRKYREQWNMGHLYLLYTADECLNW